MSIEKAKEFLKYLTDHAEVAEKMSGFDLEELKQARSEMRQSGELSDDDLDGVAGGGGFNFKLSGSW